MTIGMPVTTSAAADADDDAWEEYSEEKEYRDMVVEIMGGVVTSIVSNILKHQEHVQNEQVWERDKASMDAYREHEKFRMGLHRFHAVDDEATTASEEVTTKANLDYRTYDDQREQFDEHIDLEGISSEIVDYVARQFGPLRKVAVIDEQADSNYSSGSRGEVSVSVNHYWEVKRLRRHVQRSLEKGDLTISKVRLLEAAAIANTVLPSPAVKDDAAYRIGRGILGHVHRRRHAVLIQCAMRLRLSRQRVRRHRATQLVARTVALLQNANDSRQLSTTKSRELRRQLAETDSAVEHALAVTEPGPETKKVAEIATHVQAQLVDVNATFVGSLVRGFLCRRRLRIHDRLLQSKLASTKLLASMRVQRVFRGHRGRQAAERARASSERNHLRRYVVTMPLGFKNGIMEQVRAQLKFAKAAANRIQAVFRGHIVRRVWGKRRRRAKRKPPPRWWIENPVEAQNIDEKPHTSLWRHTSSTGPSAKRGEPGFMIARDDVLLKQKIKKKAPWNKGVWRSKDGQEDNSSDEFDDSDDDDDDDDDDNGKGNDNENESNFVKAVNNEEMWKFRRKSIAPGSGKKQRKKNARTPGAYLDDAANTSKPAQKQICPPYLRGPLQKALNPSKNGANNGGAGPRSPSPQSSQQNERGYVLSPVAPAPPSLLDFIGHPVPVGGDGDRRRGGGPKANGSRNSASRAGVRGIQQAKQSQSRSALSQTSHTRVRKQRVSGEDYSNGGSLHSQPRGGAGATNRAATSMGFRDVIDPNRPETALGQLMRVQQERLGAGRAMTAMGTSSTRSGISRGGAIPFIGLDKEQVVEYRETTVVAGDGPVSDDDGWEQSWGTDNPVELPSTNAEVFARSDAMDRTERFAWDGINFRNASGVPSLPVTHRKAAALQRSAANTKQRSGQWLGSVVVSPQKHKNATLRTSRSAAMQQVYRTRTAQERQQLMNGFPESKAGGSFIPETKAELKFRAALQSRGPGGKIAGGTSLRNPPASVLNAVGLGSSGNLDGKGGGMSFSHISAVSSGSNGSSSIYGSALAVAFGNPERSATELDDDEQTAAKWYGGGGGIAALGGGVGGPAVVQRSLMVGRPKDMGHNYNATRRGAR